MGLWKGWETHTHTQGSLTIWYYYRKSRVDMHPCCIITHTHTHTHTHTPFHIQMAMAPPSHSCIHPGPLSRLGARLSRGHLTGSVPRTLDSHSEHTEAALFSQRDWRWARWLHLLTCSRLLVRCVFHMKRDFRSRNLTAQSRGFLILCEDLCMCDIFTVFPCI